MSLEDLAHQAQFYCCDSVVGLLSLGPQSIDVIVTSPPYNIGTDYGEYKDNDAREKYLLDMAAWGMAAKWTLKEMGSLFLNISGKPSDPWIPYDVLSILRESFVLQNTIHWAKAIAINDQMFGHFKPINSCRYLNQSHEFIFHLTNTGDVPIDRIAVGVPYADPSNLKRWDKAKENELHCKGNLWYLPYKTKQRKGIHPATFPTEVPDHCLRLHGIPKPDQRESFLVCDPFCGTGATAIAAVNHGLPFVGFDINEAYLLEAVQKIKQISFQSSDDKVSG